jgi:hypothetical protein
MREGRLRAAFFLTPRRRKGKTPAMTTPDHSKFFRRRALQAPACDRV